MQLVPSMEDFVKPIHVYRIKEGYRLLYWSDKVGFPLKVYSLRRLQWQIMGLYNAVLVAYIPQDIRPVSQLFDGDRTTWAAARCFLQSEKFLMDTIVQCSKDKRQTFINVLGLLCVFQKYLVLPKRFGLNQT